jgi:hypothetical protein
MERCGLDSSGSVLDQWRDTVHTVLNRQVPQKVGIFFFFC